MLLIVLIGFFLVVLVWAMYVAGDLDLLKNALKNRVVRAEEAAKQTRIDEAVKEALMQSQIHEAVKEALKKQ